MNFWVEILDQDPPKRDNAKSGRALIRVTLHEVIQRPRLFIIVYLVANILEYLVG